MLQKTFFVFTIFSVVALTHAQTCSPQKACDFVNKLPHAWRWQTNSLICTPAEKCTLTGYRLGGLGGLLDPGGLGSTVIMENVLIQNSSVTSDGGLLRINGGGSFTGTNLIFRNGAAIKDGADGGCVFSLGNFVCTDCVFDNCTASSGGGGVFSNTDPIDWATKMLKLVRPTFTDCKAGGSIDGQVLGSGCSCFNEVAEICQGCTCNKIADSTGYGQFGFGCDSQGPSTTELASVGNNMESKGSSGNNMVAVLVVLVAVAAVAGVAGTIVWSIQKQPQDVLIPIDTASNTAYDSCPSDAPNKFEHV